MKNRLLFLSLIISGFLNAQTTTTIVGSLKHNNELTLNNTADTLLVRNPTTKKIEGVSKASLFGSLHYGYNMSTFPEKTTPIDNDIITLSDSFDGFKAKKTTFLQMWNNYFKGKTDAKYDWFLNNATKRADYILKRQSNSSKTYTSLAAREVSLQQAGDTWGHGGIINLHYASTKLYVTSIANTVDTGDNALSVNCFVRLQILQATTAGVINIPILSTITIAKNGDVVGGKTITSGAGVPNAYMIGDTLHIIWTAKCNDGIWYMMHNTVNCLTDTVGTPEICTMEGGLFYAQKVSTHLGLDSNNQLSMNGTIASFGGYYYAAAVSLDIYTKGAILRTSNFTNWEFVTEPAFTGITPKAQWEISMGALGSNLYMAMRQIDLDPSTDINSTILAKLDASCNVLDWVEIPSCTSKAEFYLKNSSELYLAFPTDNRQNSIILQINSTLRNSIPLQDMPTWGNYVSIAQRDSSNLQFVVRTLGSGVQGLRVSSMSSGIVSSTTSLNANEYTSSLTSDAQTQINNKAPIDNPAFTTKISAPYINVGTGLTGLNVYKTTDQTVNYERGVFRFNVANQLLIGAEFGGTGAAYPIIVNTNNRNFIVNNTNSVPGSFSFAATTPLIAATNTGVFRISGGWSGASSVNTTLQLSTKYQTSGTASSRELFISPYYQTAGSGSKMLIDAGTNTAADAGGTHTSLFSVDNEGLTKITTLNLPTNTVNRVAIVDALNNVVSSSVTTAELGHLSGTTSTVAEKSYTDKNKLISYTVATLPASPVRGECYAVTDATAPTYLAVVVGGGSAYTPVVWNGTNWISY